MEFSYKINDDKNICIIGMKGNLIEKSQGIGLIDDVSNLVLKETRHFILNLHDFKYMNSTGLTVLLNILTLARKAGGETVICCIPQKINELLSITKLINVFTIAKTEKDAIKFLKESESVDQ